MTSRIALMCPVCGGSSVADGDNQLQCVDCGVHWDPSAISGVVSVLAALHGKLAALRVEMAAVAVDTEVGRRTIRSMVELAGRMRDILQDDDVTQHPTDPLFCDLCKTCHSQIEPCSDQTEEGRAVRSTVESFLRPPRSESPPSVEFKPFVAECQECGLHHDPQETCPPLCNKCHRHHPLSELCRWVEKPLPGPRPRWMRVLDQGSPPDSRRAACPPWCDKCRSFHSPMEACK